MRFIHTADWHLGRLFHSRHLTDDQLFTLDGLYRLAESSRADALVIAGDIFDRAVPPPEAVTVLDGIVAALALDLDLTVIMIAGNHDSAARLEYLSELARRSGVHVVGRVGREVRPVEVRGADGTEVRFWPIAYTDPESAREELERPTIHTHEDAIAAQLETVSRHSGGAVRDVVVGHVFVSGCYTSESERELTVGGSAAVNASLFADFDYVALGHLHRPQSVGSERIRYSGSLLKYSFSETDQQKSVSVVDLGVGGELTVREAYLPIRRDVRQIRGSFAELLAMEVDDRLAESYLEAVLTDPDPVPNAVDTLRVRFPFLLSLRREESLRRALDSAAGSADIKKKTTAQLFEDFFLDVSGHPLTEEQSAEVAAALNELERIGREVVTPTGPLLGAREAVTAEAGPPGEQEAVPR